MQGSYGYTKFNVISGVQASSIGKTDGKSWHLQGGWARNVTGMGMTTLYGEYGHAEGYAAASNATAIAAPTANTGSFSTICNGGGATCFISADQLDYYGLGVTQKIDSAAMSLYLGWRHFDPKISINTSGTITSPSISSFDTVIGGARILL